MYKKDSLPIGLLIGFIFTAASSLTIWLIIGVVGFAPLEVPGKLYFLALIPSIFVMRTAMKKHKRIKTGSGVLLSVILFMALFFIALHYHWI
ncbi:MAG: hypothetical protein LBH92_04605 [Bacteroidales bacterium]|jgi:hypothetical protein|nr:hypothetical protein [Bacteroidales bacterium]